MIYWQNKKFLKAYDLLFLFPQKKLSLNLGVAHAGPAFAQVGS